MVKSAVTALADVRLHSSMRGVVDVIVGMSSAGKPTPLRTLRNQPNHQLPTGTPRKTTGISQETDFDLAVWGGEANERYIQVEIYHAPEAVLDAGYP